MDNVILIFICLILGVLLQKLRVFPVNGHATLNQYVIYISLPALSLYFIPKIVLSGALFFPLFTSWIGFAFAYVFFTALGKWLGWSKKLTGCLILTGGLGNTAFIGFPVVEALFGKPGLQTAIVLDQAGTFVVMATLGIVIAATHSLKMKAAGSGAGDILKKVFSFPPFIAFLISACMNLSGFDFTDDIQSVLMSICRTTAPLALVAVGMQLKIDRKSKYWNSLYIGLFFKLILMPAIIFTIYKVFLGGKGLAADVSVIESAMGPMVTAAVLASAYGLKPKLAGMMVGVGIPLSFITMDFWYWLLLNY
ncbi:AEC family transporter [Flavobacterium alkalisoli]|uniref:AEC family transporter n=1 Tax=Flavobacterium alkalisoli TaxID=2602769 RepID=A0A5B9FYF1_9FLAO|nr:AEC family transporter [Flavobacterium alkalisoli]QEE51419.1 AEC family transporter [Flavobacterium alkalisoli]